LDLQIEKSYSLGKVVMKLAGNTAPFLFLHCHQVCGESPKFFLCSIKGHGC
jgi:hypothetical protein